MNIIFLSSCPLARQKERLAEPDSAPIFQPRHSGVFASACTVCKSGFLAATALGDTHDIFFLVSDAAESDLLKNYLLLHNAYLFDLLVARQSYMQPLLAPDTASRFLRA